MNDITIERVTNRCRYFIGVGENRISSASLDPGRRGFVFRNSLDSDRGRYLASLLVRKATNHPGLRIVHETPRNVFTVRLGDDHITRLDKTRNRTSRVRIETDKGGGGYGQRLNSRILQIGHVHEG